MLFTLTSAQWIVLFAAATLIGLGKAGVKGVGMLIAVLMADQFGSKASTGLVIPMLSIADIMAVRYYRRDADWSYLKRLLPAALVGILLGVWLGNQIDETTFRRVFTFVILGGLVIILLQERYPISVKQLQRPLVSRMTGLLGGFTTMVGNAAGPVMSVYLLAARLPKQQFIGTTAWFFLVVNLVKIPFHIWAWETLSWSSFSLNLLALPAIILGFLVGIRIVSWIPEKGFRYLVIVITTVTAIRMLISG